MIKLKDVEETIAELDHDFEFTVYEEEKNKRRLILENLKILIPKYNLTIQSGIYEDYDESQKEYISQFSFIMLFDAETGEWLYEEQGSSDIIALANYLNNKSTIEDLEELSCEILTE